MNSVKSSTCKGPVVVGCGKCALGEARGWMGDSHKSGKEGKTSEGYGKAFKMSRQEGSKGTSSDLHIDEMAIAVLGACN